VRIVVANTPGGPSDIIAASWRRRCQEAMPGSSIIVENKGGGGGNIGMGYVARSDADGYTILLSTSAFSSIPASTTPAVTIRSRISPPFASSRSRPHVFAVMPDLGVKSMKEFVALAKANPDKFNVSDPADRNHAAAPGRGAEAARRLQKMATIVFPGGGDALKACSRARCS
jgi:tripartite-type tricarboxylate transporter receptor subunit TctC